MGNLTEIQKSFLKALLQESVDFIVIGGYAVKHYHQERDTNDIDILISRNKDNIDKFILAIRSTPIEGSISTTELLQPLKMVHLPNAANKEIDILTSAGALDFNLAIKNVRTIVIDDIPIPILGLEELIYSKIYASTKTEDPISLERDFSDIHSLMNVWSQAFL